MKPMNIILMAGSSIFSQIINVPTGTSQNLRDLANAQGYDGQRDVNITFVVQAGIVCRALPGLDAIDTGVWPDEDYEINFGLTIDGTVDGGAGVGGQGGINGSIGGTGGDGVYLRNHMLGGITIGATGQLRSGGGGGGGGGGRTIISGPPGEEEYTDILGGDGGIGGDGANPPSAGGSSQGVGAGIGGAGGEQGNPGLAGVDGTDGTGGAGGPAGAAVRKNGKTAVVTNNGGTLVGATVA